MCLLVVSLILGTGVFFAYRAAGNYSITHFYMSESSVSRRCAAIYNEFRLYAIEKQLSSKDTAAVDAWLREHPYATVAVVRDGPGPASNSAPAVSNSVPGMRYYMRFTDGIYQLTIADSSETRQYFLCSVLAVVFGGLTVILMSYFYIRRITSRVTSLARDAEALGCGDLTREIPVSGSDEISLLAREMDDMRRSVLALIASEREARQANSSLVTAMSHDLRTPMTALIGYLELLKNSEYSDETQREKFTAAAYKKSMELKELTDELFRYFLVFGGESTPPELVDYDAVILMEQLLGESVIELRAEGYNIRVLRLQKSCSIKADVLSLKRIFDNMFSNIRKYADPARPVVIMFESIDERYLSVCFSNSIKKDLAEVERNRIGLKTCSKIAEQLGGTFKTSSDGEHFAAELILPSYPPLEEG